MRISFLSVITAAVDISSKQLKASHLPVPILTANAGLD